MLTLLLLITYGIVFSFFATQNTELVNVTLLSSKYSVPLYMVVLGSLLLGIAVSWLISLVNSFFSSISIMGKDTAIKEAYKSMNALKKENQQLTEENVKLKEQHNERVEATSPSLLHSIRHNLSNT